MTLEMMALTISFAFWHLPVREGDQQKSNRKPKYVELGAFYSDKIFVCESLIRFEKYFEKRKTTIKI